MSTAARDIVNVAATATRPARTWILTSCVNPRLTSMRSAFVFDHGQKGLFAAPSCGGFPGSVDIPSCQSGTACID